MDERDYMTELPGCEDYAPPECAECRGRVTGLEGGTELLGGYEDPLSKLRVERGSDYGPVEINHGSIGAIWGGILAQAVAGGRWRVGETVPPEIVTLMMVGLKLSREAYKHKTDNIDDAQNYLDFTDELSGEKR